MKPFQLSPFAFVDEFGRSTGAWIIVSDDAQAELPAPLLFRTENDAQAFIWALLRFLEKDKI